MFYIDPLYIILVMPAVLLAVWAQIKVNTTFKKYSKLKTSRSVTGAQCARMILDRNGLYAVRVLRIGGELTDHYDPKENVIRLSESVYDSDSAAAIGVAAHESGHAVQFAENYAPVKIRTAIIPATRIGSFMSFPLILLGLFFLIPGLVYAGIAFFGFSTLFQAVTLPVELDASKRALQAMDDSNYFTGEELKASSKVLRAAALTYVAALAVSLMQLLRLLLLFGGAGNRKR